MLTSNGWRGTSVDPPENGIWISTVPGLPAMNRSISRHRCPDPGAAAQKSSRRIRPSVPTSQPVRSSANATAQ